jgi:N-acetylmuramoyl-L-alanine amidase
MNISYLLFLTAVLSSNLAAGVLSDGKEGEIDIVDVDGDAYVRTTVLAEFLGGNETLDFVSKKGRSDFEGFSIEYTLYSTFIKSGDDVYNIYKPVIYEGGSFLLPIRYLTAVFNQVSNLEFSFSGRKLKVGRSSFNVTGIDAVQKINGLLVEIQIKDELRFEALRTDDNWLVVTLVDGKVDSLAFTKPLAVKAIYEVKTYQFDNSCQVSIRLRPKEFTFTSKIKEDPLRLQVLVRGDGFSNPAALAEEFGRESQRDNPINVIVIDPGHGGKDNGAVGPSSIKEKDIVLKIGRYLYKLLKDDGRFKPVMTRQDDVFVPLADRTELANSVGGDLFISIHANAAQNRKASGIIAFFLAEPKSDQARAAASLENSSIRFEELEQQRQYNSDIDFTLRDMMQSEFLRESADLADIIQVKMSNLTGLGSRGVDQAGFFVLDKAYMPAVLLETAFITNKADERKLRDDNFQRKTARSIYESIVAFKEKYESREQTGGRSNGRTSQ